MPALVPNCLLEFHLVLLIAADQLPLLVPSCYIRAVIGSPQVHYLHFITELIIRNRHQDFLRSLVIRITVLTKTLVVKVCVRQIGDV
jgi:hypothetical protein